MTAPAADGGVVMPAYAQRAREEGASAIPLSTTLGLAIEALGARLDEAGELVTRAGAPLDGRAAYYALADSSVLDQLGVDSRITPEVMVSALEEVRVRLAERAAAGEPAPAAPASTIEITTRPESNSAPWPGRADEQGVSVRSRSWWWG